MILSNEWPDSLKCAATGDLLNLVQPLDAPNITNIKSSLIFESVNKMDYSTEQLSVFETTTRDEWRRPPYGATLTRPQSGNSSGSCSG
ncbi:hypothetical protein DPMN_194900 [Dreissena polymorpha]|uniref:Uncharacterized protein n=1 Tax=Dreissena polymorpha TaxID=45954 RepID=A0A9D3Y2R3_DREPO|nr:hypothetical protein DPMN_194900 [Dreissena polymorpha]